MIAKPFDPDTLLRAVRLVLDAAPTAKAGIPSGEAAD